MKKNKINKYLRMLSNFSLFTPMVLIPIFGVVSQSSNIKENNTTTVSLLDNNQKNQDFDYSWHKNSNNANMTTNNHTVPSSFKDKWTLDGTTQQDTTYDEKNNSFATLTSSTEVQTKNGKATDVKYDQISKFWLSDAGEDVKKTTRDDEEITHVPSTPGTIDWMVKKSDLDALITPRTNPFLKIDPTKTTIKSIVYSSGGEILSKSLFVILESTDGTSQGSFLFQIKWENDVNKQDDAKDQEAGAYRLVRKLTAETGEDTDDYKYNSMVVVSPSTHTLKIFALKKFEGSKISSGITIKAISIALGDFGDSSTSLTKFEYKIENDAISSKVDNSQNYFPVFAYTSSSLGSNAIIMYQAEKFKTSSNKEKLLFSVFLKTNVTTNETIKAEHKVINSVDLSSLKFKDNSAFKTTFTLRNSSSFDLFFTQKDGDNKKENLGHLTYDFTHDYNGDSSRADSGLKADAIEGLPQNVNFLDVKQTYTATSELNGYIALTDDNKVYTLDINFSNPKLLCDFNSLSFQLGKIYKIITTMASSSWYAQRSDLSYAQFSGNTLIGQWDKVSTQDSYELPLFVTIKTQNEVSPSIIYQQVADSGNEDYDSKFEDYLNNGEAYKDFLTVNFQDPRVSLPPDITIEKSKFPKPTQSTPPKPYDDEEDEIRTYDVKLTFKQKLRKINNFGQVVEDSSTSGKELVIAEQTYTFNNEIGNVSFVDKKDVPAFIKNKLPSQVTKEEVENYLINFDNVKDYTINSTYNDANGSMKVRVVVPYMWKSVGGEKTFVSNEVFTNNFVADDPSNPFFAANPLGASGSITPVDEDYINDKEHEVLKNELTAKYGSKLPSEIPKKEMIEAFTIFGPAFTVESNIDVSIVLPDEDQVNVIPFDKEGYARIDILFPKIGHLKDVRVVFDTPKIFLTNKTANSTVYFMFKQNDEVLETELKSKSKNPSSKDSSPSKISDLKASHFVNKLSSSNANNNSSVIENLRYFADFSNYFDNSINNGETIVNADANDNYGTLKIKIKLTDDVKETLGFKSNVIETVFSGFKREGSSSLTDDNFKFSDKLSGDISNISPLDMTIDKLFSAYGAMDSSVSATTKDKIDRKNIELKASTLTGTLQVIVKIENYVENGKVLPKKAFLKTYTGFKVSKDVYDMIIWKSFIEIIESRSGYASQVPSNIVNILNESKENNLEKLVQFARVSENLKDELDPEKMSLIFIADDKKGELKISLNINLNGNVFSTQTIISGFVTNGMLSPTIVFANEKDENLINLRQKLPTEITPADASKLYTIENGKAYINSAEIVADNATGTLKITVSVKNEDGNLVVTTGNEKLFNNFKKFIPVDQETNWFIIGASTIIPAMILIIPIILLSILSVRRNMKKIAKQLDNRLVEEYKNKKKW